jgi:hypothetical protein
MRGDLKIPIPATDRAVPAAPALPRSLAQLCAFVRSALHGTLPDRAALPQTETAWSAFGHEVARQRLGPFLLARLPPAAAQLLPPAIVARFARSRDVYAAHATRQLAELDRALDVLAAAGVSARCLKGPLLSSWLYGSPGLRHASDLDLLVHESDVGAADAALRRAGCRRIRPGFALSPRQDREYRRAHYEFSYTAPGSGLEIELAWRLEELTPAAWTRPAASVHCHGRDYSVPPADLLAAYLCVHGARHGWCRLFWLLDVALLFRREDLDWAAALALARAHGADAPALQAAQLAASLFAVAPPAVLQPANPTEARRTASLAREALRQLSLRPVEETTTREWMRQLVYRLRLARDWPRRRELLRPHLLSLATWETVSLPDRWFAIYYLLTPPLWIVRRLRRAWRRLFPQPPPQNS